MKIFDVLIFKIALLLGYALRKKATIHQVTTMLSTSRNVLLPGHNHVLTTGTDDPSLIGTWVIVKVSGHQQWWLWHGNRTFLEVASKVVTRWIVAFFAQWCLTVLPVTQAIVFSDLIHWCQTKWFPISPDKYILLSRSDRAIC